MVQSKEESSARKADTTMNSPRVHHVSECFIKPQTVPEEWTQPLHLPPWDLVVLSIHYIQKGLLYAKPHPHSQPTTEEHHNHEKKDDHFMETLLERLKSSLSLALVHFYPLAGRLKTIKGENPPSCSVYVDCNDSPGARFVYATLDMTVSDILSETYVPPVVQSFFDHHKAVNHDGHAMSLFSVQVTELVDGVFIGCSMNHCLGDGTSYWNFLNSWSEIFRGECRDGSTSSTSISHPPILKRWFHEGHGPIVKLPYSLPEEFICRFEAPELRERIFHFSADSIAKLKARANAECNSNTKEISSFQSLSALVWRCVMRARNLPPNETTNCCLTVNNRTRMNPPLPQNYFGNSVYALRASATAGELLEHDLGWAALKVHQAVVNYDEKAVFEFLDAWTQSPYILHTSHIANTCNVTMGSSPRFNKYGSEFGMGKALALRSGYANKFDGKVSGYPGRDGGGSIDLEVCLPPSTMSALEADKDFMEAAGLLSN